MTDIVLSSFLSLFALFGKEEQVDEERAKAMLVSYLCHHFGVRNIDAYLDFYSDMRMAYDMTDNLNTEETVAQICESLHGKIPAQEEPMLLLRIMEFSMHGTTKGSERRGIRDGKVHPMFRVMADKFNISDETFSDFVDFVTDKKSEHVLLLKLRGFEGQLKTLLSPTTGRLIFTYLGDDTVLLNDVPVLSGVYQV